MIDNGWIKLHRKLLDWEWMQEPNTFTLFIFLILSANHEDRKWKGIEIKRGQLIAGLKSLNERTKISIQSLRTSLSRLEETGEITKKSTSKYTVITINNYDTYQITDSEINKPSTNHQQAINKQSTTNNNRKNGRIEEKKDYIYTRPLNQENQGNSETNKSISSHKCVPLSNQLMTYASIDNDGNSPQDKGMKPKLTEENYVENSRKSNIGEIVCPKNGNLFETLWAQYPNKDGKKAALKHYISSVKTDQDKSDIQKAINNYIASDRVRNGYIKNGATWFNNWKDWIEYKDSKSETTETRDIRMIEEFKKRIGE